MAARLKELYLNKVRPDLMKRFDYNNIMQVPRLDKIVINMGVGEAVRNNKILDSTTLELATISGQKPVITKAKKSIAGFKIREGMPIGCKVTMRQDRMYEFLDRLVNVAIPRIRDFGGTSPNAFDGRGNYTIGIGEQLIFPEIDYDSIVSVQGMDIVFVTTAPTDEEGKELLKLMGMPMGAEKGGENG